MLKCPKCEKPIGSSVRMESVSAGAGFSIGYKAVAYGCPNVQCGAVFSVQLDPDSLKAELLKELRKEVRNMTTVGAER
jgi:hypothetical protein